MYISDYSQDCEPGVQECDVGPAEWEAVSLEPGPGSPLANSHFILTVRPAVLFVLSFATHPLLWDRGLACKSLAQASDLQMTLEHTRSSSKASKVFRKLSEEERPDRQADSTD